MAKVRIFYKSYNNCPEATEFSKAANKLHYIAGILFGGFSFIILLSMIAPFLERKPYSSIMEFVSVVLFYMGILLVDFFFYVGVPALIELHCLKLVSESPSGQSQSSKEQIQYWKKIEIDMLKGSFFSFLPKALSVVLAIQFAGHLWAVYGQGRQTEVIVCAIGLILCAAVFFAFTRGRNRSNVNYEREQK